MSCRSWSRRRRSEWRTLTTDRDDMMTDCYEDSENPMFLKIILLFAVVLLSQRESLIDIEAEGRRRINIRRTLRLVVTRATWKISGCEKPFEFISMILIRRTSDYAKTARDQRQRHVNSLRRLFSFSLSISSLSFPLSFDAAGCSFPMATRWAQRILELLASCSLASLAPWHLLCRWTPCRHIGAGVVVHGFVPEHPCSLHWKPLARCRA